jgi:hypothetical protein
MPYRIQLRGAASSKTLQTSDSVVVMISLGQDYHEEEQFYDSMAFLKDLGVKITFVIADTLQAHTKKISEPDKTLDELKETCREQAEEWKTRNYTALALLGELNKGFLTWDAYLDDPVYEQCVDKIWSLYNDDEDSAFKHIVESVVNKFANNLNNKLKFKRLSSTPLDLDSIKKHSRAYIMEECAVFAMWIYFRERYGYSHLIYPAKWHAAFDYLRDKCLGPNPSILKPIQLDIHEQIHTITADDLPKPTSTSIPPLFSPSSSATLPMSALRAPRMMPLPSGRTPPLGLGASRLRFSHSAPASIPLPYGGNHGPSSSAPTSPRDGFFEGMPDKHKKPASMKSGHSSWPGPGLDVSAASKPSSSHSAAADGGSLEHRRGAILDPLVFLETLSKESDKTRIAEFFIELGQKLRDDVVESASRESAELPLPTRTTSDLQEEGSDSLRRLP